MVFSSWLRNLLSSPSRGRRVPGTVRKPAGFRPRLEALEGRDVPSTLTVTNILDSGAGSLRAEIALAKSKDTIVFAPTLAGKAITLTSGELTITQNLTIQGLGAGALSISGGNASRVFEVDGAKTTVTLSGLTITHGRSDVGGGLLNYGKLTVSDCTISSNVGGGIDNNGTLTLTHCTLAYNTSTYGSGGGLQNNGTASLNGCTLLDNVAQFGGGIYNAAGVSSVSVSGCTFASSSPDSGLFQGALYGGAIYVNAGAVTVNNSTFTSNVAETAGGGTALYIRNGSLTLSGSTFSDPYNYESYFTQNSALGHDYIEVLNGRLLSGSGNTFQ